jgi:acetylornithine deacetylase
MGIEPAVEERLRERLLAAVSTRREELIELVQLLVRERSVLGGEQGAQHLIAERLATLGFTVERVAIEAPPNAEVSTWGYPPSEFEMDGQRSVLTYDDRACVAGRIHGSGDGRSLHLAGHVDVVPVEAPESWEHDPWGGELVDERIWGRGAGDMKAGLAAYLIGAAAYLDVCAAPRGDLLFSSVIEEECTGNGMKAVLEAGWNADATLIGEPSALTLMHAGVGVIWARLTVHSGGAHPAFSDGASSSIRILQALDAVRELEQRMNERAPGGAGRDEVFFAAHERPFKLNVGTLSGGAWPSSEPAHAEARLRLGFGLETTPAEAQRLLADAVAQAPGVEISFEGFRAPAYCDALDHDLATALSGAHEALHGAPAPRQVLAATTDARSVTGPCICYGPLAGAIHGTDEWVDVDSTVAVAEAIALTIAAWQRS